jgi:zinc D-Ala-D-Ala dipeptidase
MVDLREAAPSVVIVRPGTVPWCRRRVAEMAEAAARSLPAGVRLGVTEAWRPFERQVAIFERMTDFLREARPGLSRSVERRIVCRWCAPTDQKAPPGHCTGAALDVVLLGPDGEQLDLTSPFERFQAAPTFVFGLSESARRNRDLLFYAMTGAGFSNCRDEYWHYSYGDAGWAVRMGEPECRYGRVDLPRELWDESQRLWLEAFAERQNPFLPSV